MRTGERTWGSSEIITLIAPPAAEKNRTKIDIVVVFHNSNLYFFNNNKRAKDCNIRAKETL